MGLPKDLAQKIGEFASIARVVAGVTSLKVFGFGPRPQDFLACNAPIQPIYDLGATVMENSELDLLVEFKKAAKDKAREEAWKKKQKEKQAARVDAKDSTGKAVKAEQPARNPRNKKEMP